MRLPIRLKLAAALGVPVVVLVAVTVVEVGRSVAEAREVREQTGIALTVLGPKSLLTSLQLERDITIATMIGMQDAIVLAVEDVDVARADTDRAVAEFRDYLDGPGRAARAAYAPAVDQIDRLAEVRAAADGYDGPNNLIAAKDVTDAIYVEYDEITSAFSDANSKISVSIEDTILRRGTQLIDLAARQLDIRGDLARALLIGQLSLGGLDTSAEFRYVGETAGTYDDYLAQIRSTASGSYTAAARNVLAAEQLQLFRAQADVAIETGQVDVGTVFATSSNPPDEGYGKFHDDVASVLRDRAADLNQAAASRERWFVTLGFVALLGAVTLIWLVSRSITRPLRSLTQQATVLAHEGLPTAVREILETPPGEDVHVSPASSVKVEVHDEISDVAETLNSVQHTALDLAVEQAILRRNIADSFVSLGRRNQNLLSRQLDFITELEIAETDPETLANLFRLDHLATRMRRNAESLLVLAGVAPARTWAVPVRLTDVLRAALGEVEDYRRVAVHGVEPATIIGSAAADVAHLLAELLENALTFSPPSGEAVDLRGRMRRPDYTLAVIDAGVGMTSDEIDAANRRLAGAESFTVAPSKYLGHYVAGHLARRHGIRVRLGESPGGGVTATLDLPADILAIEADPPSLDGGVGPAPGPPAPVGPAVEPAGFGLNRGHRPLRLPSPSRSRG